ncbi:hypothetical protein [Schaalia vaccimaxillae]|uniref:hypothetical protein n=1 Tax=Schaalia vaccimaxillae TaxID=183916 RepID=UPI0003B3B880|nr:hypothetical protein [Schaalia vaccimaxillae]
MSTPNQPEEPRYGQRSEGAAPDPQVETPWPQYGVVNGQQPSSGSYSTGAPQYSQSSGPAYSSAAGPTAGGAPFAGVPKPAGNLPSRTPGVLTLVVGIVLAVVAAPIALLIGIFSSIDMGSLVSDAGMLSNGDTVTVDDSGSYIIASNGYDVYNCSLIGSDGTEHAMESVPGANTSFIANGLKPGSYTVNCGMEGNAQLTGITGVDPGSLTNAGLVGFGWATAIGLIGIIVGVIGIVMLVKVNARRRQMMNPTRY